MRCTVNKKTTQHTTYNIQHPPERNKNGTKRSNHNKRKLKPKTTDCVFLLLLTVLLLPALARLLRRGRRRRRPCRRNGSRPSIPATTAPRSRGPSFRPWASARSSSSRGGRGRRRRRLPGSARRPTGGSPVAGCCSSRASWGHLLSPSCTCTCGGGSGLGTKLSSTASCGRFGLDGFDGFPHLLDSRNSVEWGEGGRQGGYGNNEDQASRERGDNTGDFLHACGSRRKMADVVEEGGNGSGVLHARMAGFHDYLNHRTALVAHTWGHVHVP